MELLTNPIIWLLTAIVVVAIIETKKSKKCSTKSKGANKTSYATKPTYASSGLKKKKKTPTRARKKGKFVADDPTTPQNEAWEGGKAPTKKKATRKTAKKRVAKKTTAKKSSAKKN